MGLRLRLGLEVADALLFLGRPLQLGLWLGREEELGSLSLALLTLCGIQALLSCCLPVFGSLLVLFALVGGRLASRIPAAALALGSERLLASLASAGCGCLWAVPRFFGMIGLEGCCWAFREFNVLAGNEMEF